MTPAPAGDTGVRIACVLINYRNPEDTSACLDSLKASGAARRFAIVLVNNHAADGSGAALRAQLERDGFRFRYLDPGRNLGFAGGMNLGIAAALEDGCTHVLMLNNDAVVAPDFAARAAEAAEAHPGEVLAGLILDHATGRPSWNIGTFSPLTAQIRHIHAADYSGPVDFVSGALMIAPAEAFRRAGLFDERYFMYCEDYDFCLRLARERIRIRYCPGIVIRHKVSSSVSRSRTPKEYYRIRNQTHATLARAKPSQRAAYLLTIPAMLAYKLARRPRLFAQAFLGVLHGLAGRLGRTHGEEGAGVKA